MPVTIHNEIEIAVSAGDLFNYVTQAMEKISMVALNNLKQKMRARTDES